MTDRGVKPKDRVRWIARIAVSLAILCGIALLVDIPTVGRAFAQIPVGLFLLAVLLNMIASIVVPALQTRAALGATRIRLSVRDLVGINLMIRFYILILPRPAAIGIRWWVYRAGGEEGSQGSEAAALMMFERVVQAVVLSGAVVFLLPFERGGIPAASEAVWLVCVTLFIGAIVGLAAFLWAPAASIPRLIVGGRLVPKTIKEKALKLIQAIEAYPHLSIGRVLLIVLLSILQLIFAVWSLEVLIQAVGFSLDFVAITWIRSAVSIITMLPVTVAGIGLREASFVGFLSMFAISEAESVATAAAAFAVQLVIGLLGATVALARQWRGSRNGQGPPGSPGRAPINR